MFALFASALALSEPQGSYAGSTRVAFKKIRVEMATVSSSGPGKGTFSLKVTGIPGGHVDCPAEEYLVDGSDLQMPNMETEGDCAHDQFKSSSLTLKSATYDSDKDSITMKAKWKGISVTIEAKKVAADFAFFDAYAAMQEFVQEVNAPALAEPKGHYVGKTRVAFKAIHVEMETVSSSGPGAGTFMLKVTGIPGGHVDCPTEEYKVVGTDLQMPNMETEGDCAHDQFKSSSLTLKSATYDPVKDTITMKAKWKAISVTIEAKKVAADFDFDAFVAMSEAQEVNAPALAEPMGHYEGSTRVAFKKITVTMETVSSSGPGKGTFLLKVAGIPGGHVDCPAEEYLVDGTDLQMPNMETEGDCAHDQFKSSSLTLKSATYDPVKDTITMKAKWKAISVTITAKKKAANFADFEESTGSLERLQRLQLAN